MFTSGFEKISGALGELADKLAKKIKLRGHEIKKFRKDLAADIYKRRNRIRKGQVKGK